MKNKILRKTEEIQSVKLVTDEILGIYKPKTKNETTWHWNGIIPKRKTEKIENFWEIQDIKYKEIRSFIGTESEVKQRLRDKKLHWEKKGEEFIIYEKPHLILNFENNKIILYYDDTIKAATALRKLAREIKSEVIIFDLESEPTMTVYSNRSQNY